jgi:hypothetical protein
MITLPIRCAAAALLTLLADLSLYDQTPGAGLTLFALATGGSLLALGMVKLPKVGLWPVLWCVLAAGAAFDSSWIGRLLLLALTWMMLAGSILPQHSSFFEALLRGAVGGARSLGAIFSDSRRITLLQQSRLARGRLHQFPLWVYALPLGLMALFALLIIPANLVLVDAAHRLIQNLVDLFRFLVPERIVFWLLAGLLIYGGLRFKLGRRVHVERTPVIPPVPTALDNEYRACLLTFAGLNALFFVANLTDAMYLWFSMQLPAGLTWSQFAHQGSYRLIVAVILAAVTVTLFFRTGTRAAAEPKARALAYFFVIQNLIVLAGAARRLMLYVEVYGLTRFRLATFLWLLLVSIGFVLLLIKLWQQRRFSFLLETNAIATVLFLSVVSLLNMDGIIADWNVRRFEAGQAAAVDVAYLAHLGPGALPALARLSWHKDVDAGVQASIRTVTRVAEERELQERWQSWTWRRKLALDEVMRIKIAD